MNSSRTTVPNNSAESLCRRPTQKEYSTTSVISSLKSMHLSPKLQKLLLLICLRCASRSQQARWEQIFALGLLSGSEFPWASVAPIPVFSRLKNKTSGKCLEGLLVFQKMLMETQPIVWLFKPDNSTSDEKKQHQISVLHKPFWQTSQRCMLYIMEQWV